MSQREQEEPVPKGNEHIPSWWAWSTLQGQSLHVDPSVPACSISTALVQPGMFTEPSTIPTVAGCPLEKEPTWLALLGYWKPSTTLLSVRKFLITKVPVIQPIFDLYLQRQRGIKKYVTFCDWIEPHLIF